MITGNSRSWKGWPVRWSVSSEIRWVRAGQVLARQERRARVNCPWITVRGRGRILGLEPLPPEDLPRLAERLIDLYAQLHPGLSLDGRARDRFFAHVRAGVKAGALATTRSVARLTVEYLDLLRHGRDSSSSE